MSKRIFSLLAVLVLCVLTLTGCSSGSQSAETSASLYVTLINTYVPDNAADGLSQTLLAALPQTFAGETGLTVNSISSGDTENDPMGAMAGMTQIAGMMASGEMELMLCDATNARRHGDNASIYIPLSELFTEQEQEELGIVPITLALMDDEGNPTGEQSAPCGVDLSGCTQLVQLMGTKDVGAYLLIDSPHAEQAKEVIRCLLTME